MNDATQFQLEAVSPLDGRYRAQTEELAGAFSECALMKYRVKVELAWLREMAERPELGCVRALTNAEASILENLAADFDVTDAARVKAIEATTQHDVKAVEYYLKERLADTSLADIREFVHFCCTSEDINNLAYALMLRRGVTQVWLPLARQLVEQVATLAQTYRNDAVLARTHGQPASPTTLGKELAVFVGRWRRQLSQIANTEYLGKFNGTVGNFHTHSVAYPDTDWPQISRQFVERLGLTHNPLTTQIEPHDFIAELCHAVMRFHAIALDFNQDVWTYISLGYFRQKIVAGEVGSSTMPHKVNPINFENSEANLGISNALLGHLALKLPVSRLQRDLTDSSALRNLGTALGHSIVALRSALRGVSGLEVDKNALKRDLENAWEVLAEPIQTVMKRAGHANAYEQLKELTRGAGISREAIRAFVADLDLPDDDKRRLLALTPETYVGLASSLVGYIHEP